MDCSPPGSSVCGILQLQILEWVAISSSRVSSPPRDQTHVSCVSCIGKQTLYHGATRKGRACLKESKMTLNVHQSFTLILFQRNYSELVREIITWSKRYPRKPTLQNCGAWMRPGRDWSWENQFGSSCHILGRRGKCWTRWPSDGPVLKSSQTSHWILPLQLPLPCRAGAHTFCPRSVLFMVSSVLSFCPWPNLEMLYHQDCLCSSQDSKASTPSKKQTDLQSLPRRSRQKVPVSRLSRQEGILPLLHPSPKVRIWPCKNLGSHLLSLLALSSSKTKPNLCPAFESLLGLAAATLSVLEKSDLKVIQDTFYYKDLKFFVYSSMECPS